MTSANRIVLARHPEGEPRAEDLAVQPYAPAELADGQLLVRAHWLSVDPMFALLIGKAPLGGALPSFPVGTPIPGPGIAEVVESKAPGFVAGDWVEGRIGWQDAGVIQAAAVRKIAASDGVSALGATGLPGFTAWLGIDLAGDLHGKTILISGAAGAVGSIAGQLAKMGGARVVGLASSDERREYLTGELGFDVALDHRSPDLAASLAALGGIHVYFDNVGGPLLGAVLPALARNAKILVCGLMSAYTGAPASTQDGALMAAIMSKCLTVMGFNNREHLARFPAFEAEMNAMLAEGRIKERFNVTEGLEGVIAHMSLMFSDDTIGKRVARIV